MAQDQPPRSIDIDNDLNNADWLKGNWDLPFTRAKDLPALRKFIKREGGTLAGFKKLPIYRWNVARMPWLADIEDESKDGSESEDGSEKEQDAEESDPDWLARGRFDERYLGVELEEDFDPDKHPRDERGRFSSTGSTGSGRVEQAPSFKTSGEAEAWLSERHPGVVWDFTGTSPSVLPELATQINALAKEWPGVMQDLKYVGTYEGKQARDVKITGNPYVKTGGEPASAFAADWNGGEAGHALSHTWTMSGEAIGLNPNFYGDPGRLQAALDRGVQTGWFVPGSNTISAQITHEFGHLVDGYLERQSLTTFMPEVQPNGFGIVGETTRAFMQAHGAAGNDVSTYAKAGPAEAWAESFAALHYTPRDQWSAYTRDQAALMHMLQVEHPPATWVQHRAPADVPVARLDSSRAEADRLQQRIGIRPR